MACEPRRALSLTDYTIACICPMGVELAPVEAMLDEIHRPLPTNRDHNAYTLGHISGHNVVVAVMPQIGNNAAATVATQLLNDFPSVRFGLLVGIGGGVPSETSDPDIRLGDVVVSQPTDTFGGVVQYDLGKRLAGGRFERTGQLNQPPLVLAASVRKLQAQHLRQGNQISVYLSEIAQRYPRMQAQYSPITNDQDQLFLPAYAHQSGDTCDRCDLSQTVSRPARPDHEPRIHYGTIGSANVVVKDAITRDRLRKDMHILCVEMEAAGLMNNFPCLVIRGICDYADSHKNKRWQPYAAATAAAYMKELLTVIPAQQVVQTRSALAGTPPDYGLGLHLGEAPVIDEGLFVGRLPELKAMEDILMPGKQFEEQHRLILGGLGGMGKTQLAITYAQRHRQSYESIFWLNATSELNLKTSFRLVAKRLPDPQTYERLEDEQLLLRVHQWFSEGGNTRWLLIFDNHDEPELFKIRQYYPYASHGSVIVTTRQPDALDGKQIQVGPLSHINESIQILGTRSQRPNVEADIYAHRLAERLQGLPLALATAGAYLRKTTLSFAQYLQVYEERWDINPRRPVQLQEYQDRTLYTTWNLSYARLKKDDPLAAKLLALLAYFGHQYIWYELFHAGVNDDSPEWLHQTVADATEFENTMSVLVEYCFAEVQNSAESYSIHTCVHDWTLAGLNKVIDPQQYWYAFDCVAAKIGENDWESLRHLRYARLTPHAMWLLHDRFRQVNQIDSIGPRRLDGASDIAGLLKQQVQLTSAEQMYLRVLAGREKALGPDHTSTLDTVHNLGLLYTDHGKLEKAENMYTRALVGRKESLGPDHTSTLDTVHSLALVYTHQGKVSEGEKMYKQALAVYEKTLGPEHALTLRTINNLGDLYRYQGRLDEAEQMLLRALVGREKTLGPEHISTLDTIHHLGILYAARGQADKAEKTYKQALAAYERVLGPEHALTLRTAYHLGGLYHEQGKLGKAEQMLVRALAGLEKALGLEHISTLDTIHHLGVLYAAQGKVDKAEETYKQALSTFERILGPEHAATLRTVSSLGELYHRQDRLDEAEQMLVRALVWREKTLGPEHTLTLNTIHDLGVLYAAQGKADKAEKTYRQALAAYERLIGPEHTSTLRTVNDLGMLYTSQGELHEAEKMYKQALAGYERVLGPEHASTLATVNNLGDLYRNQDRLDEAEQMLVRTLAGYGKVLGPEHTQTLSTVNSLGMLYASQGKLNEAEKMYKQALVGKKESLGSDHTSTLDTITNLGVLYVSQHKLDEAEKMYKQALGGYEGVLGPEHASTLTIVNNLGDLYRQQGKLDEADQMLVRGLAGREKTLGSEHTSTLDTVHNLGTLYANQGKLEKAEKALMRALTGKQKALGPDHTSTLGAIHGLGWVYALQNKPSEAEKMCEQALAGYEKALGPEHASTLRAVTDLGIVYLAQGKLGKAVQMYQRARRRQHGPRLWLFMLVAMFALFSYSYLIL